MLAENMPDIQVGYSNQWSSQKEIYIYKNCCMAKTSCFQTN